MSGHGSFLAIPKSYRLGGMRSLNDSIGNAWRPIKELLFFSGTEQEIFSQRFHDSEHARRGAGERR
ncbi:hypothetical protein, partial [Mesorhizobium sp.]|uniref:hypothetical protein n=1 Tax=Mesorhizobium sp. TaxID=1871066 RepID=UPI0025C462BB